MPYEGDRPAGSGVINPAVGLDFQREEERRRREEYRQRMGAELFDYMESQGIDPVTYAQQRQADASLRTAARREADQPQLAYDPYTDSALVAHARAAYPYKQYYGGGPVDVRDAVDHYLRTSEGQEFATRRAGQALLAQTQRDLAAYEESIPGAVDSYYSQMMRDIERQSRQRAGRDLSRLAARGGLHSGARGAMGRYYEQMQQEAGAQAAARADSMRMEALKNLSSLRSGLGSQYFGEARSLADLEQRRQRAAHDIKSEQDRARASAYGALAQGLMNVVGAGVQGYMAGGPPGAAAGAGAATAGELLKRPGTLRGSAGVR